MRRWIWGFAFFLFLFSSLGIAADKAILLDINGPIGPATQDYVKRGIQYAVEQHAMVVILQLNTPGGLERSMRNIDQAILDPPFL